MLRFVHLSDIHFSNRDSKIGFDPDRELRNRMLGDIKAEIGKLGPATAILVSGDIAYAGQRTEYEDAAIWLDAVCDAAGCDRAQVRTCPGNHDIDQGVIKDNQLIQDGHDAVRREKEPFDRESALDKRLRQSAVGAMFYAPLAAYNNFAARYGSSFFADEESFALDNDFRLNDGSTLRLRSLNSALLSGLSDREKTLYLGPRAVTLSKQIGVEYLTMSHHPPNWLLDGRETENTLDADARVQLFGHEHDSRVSPGRDWIKLFAGAVNPHRKEPNWKPGYNIIEARVVTGKHRKLHVDVTARQWQGHPPQFTTIEDRGGAKTFHVELKLDDLPENWCSPWPEPEAVVSAVSSETASTEDIANKEANMATKPSRFRSIVYRFFRRSLSEKNEIVGALRLVDDEDTKLIDVERFKLQLMRAKERDQLDALEEMIAKMEVGA